MIWRMAQFYAGRAYFDPWPKAWRKSVAAQQWPLVSVRES
jgi:hypothetical protein